MSSAQVEDLMLETEDDDEVLENKFLMCNIGDEIYGIDIRDVTDIIELQKITEVPDMPEYVKGVINLRGQVIPVVDMRLRFQMQEREYDDRNCIVVVDIQDLSVGFIVDTVTEVQEIAQKDIDPPPVFRSGDAAEDTHKVNKQFVSGLGKVGTEVRILLDVKKLVQEDEVEQLKGGVNGSA